MGFSLHGDGIIADKLTGRIRCASKSINKYVNNIFCASKNPLR